LASPVLSLAIYSIIHYTKILHQLLQTTSIHRQIITALEGRSLELYKRTDDMPVLRSELPAGLTNKAHGTITISMIYVLLCFEKLLLINNFFLGYLDVKSL
jgi:phosphatidylinositol glycan class V